MILCPSIEYWVNSSTAEVTKKQKKNNSYPSGLFSETSLASMFKQLGLLLYPKKYPNFPYLIHVIISVWNAPFPHSPSTKTLLIF
jgi:hypothetical protein